MSLIQKGLAGAKRFKQWLSSDDGKFGADIDSEDLADLSDNSSKEALEEYRRGHEMLVRSIEAVDDSAARTARTSLIILSVLISAIGLAPERTWEFVGQIHIILGILGIVALVGSAMYNIFAYAYSTYSPSIGPGFVELIAESNPSAKEIRLDLLPRYSRWVDELYTGLENTKQAFFFGQFFLAVAVLILFLVGADLVFRIAPINSFFQMILGNIITMVVGLFAGILIAMGAEKYL